MPIFNLTNINSLIQFENDLEHHFDKISHIQKCYDGVLTKALFKHFGNSYLFHRAYYLDENKKFHSVEFKLPSKSEDTKQITKYINEGVQSIESGEQPFSFTELMCMEHKQVLCLYKTKLKVHNIENQGLSLHQNIKDPNVISSISHFFKKEQLNISRLIDYYEKIVGSVNSKSCFMYFIRPLTNFKNYNGVFSIILKRQLKENEIIELGSIWRKVLSDTVIIEVQNEAKMREQNFIFEEHTHTWNSEITALNQHLDVIDKRFGEDLKNQDFSLVRNHINFAISKTKILREIIQLNLFLMKVQGYKNWDEFTVNKFSISSKDLIDSNAVKNVDIKTELQKALKTALTVIESYKDIDENSERKEQQLKQLLNKVNKFSKITTRAIPIGAYIIFLDLLKNAFYHMDNNGFVDIDFKIENDSCFLCFKNDGKLPKKVIDFINLGEFKDKLFFRRVGGIRTIRRIIDCPLFCDLAQTWKIHANNNEKATNICLIIPIK